MEREGKEALGGNMGEGLGCWGGAALQGIPKSFPYRNRCLHAWRNPKKAPRCEHCPWSTAGIEASVGQIKCLHGSCVQRSSPDLCWFGAFWHSAELSTWQVLGAMH